MEGGGGAQKTMSTLAHHEREPRSPSRPGLQLSGFFIRMLIQIGIKNKSIKFLVGGACCAACAPSKPATSH